MRTRPATILLLAVAPALLVVGCATDPAPAGAPGTATVAHVIDGDTIVVRIGGAEERVRLIGIDTPETVAPDRPVECYGPEATARASALLPPGAVVLLERDVEARDTYDRLLAYVFRAEDGVHVNLLLVEEGYAEASSFPPNTARDADFAAAEAAARRERRGLWGACP